MKTLWIICYFPKLRSASTTQFRTIVPKPYPYFCQDALIYVHGPKNDPRAQSEFLSPALFPVSSSAKIRRKRVALQRMRKMGVFFPISRAFPFPLFDSSFLRLCTQEICRAQKNVAKNKTPISRSGGWKWGWSLLTSTQSLGTSVPNAQIWKQRTTIQFF